MSFVQVPPDSTGKKVDTRQMVDGSDTVERQVVVIGDPSVPGAVLPIKAEDAPSADGDYGIPILGVRRDSDSPSVGTDGDYTHLKMDEAGRLKVAAQPASYPLITGNITANGQTVFLDCSRGSNVIAHMVATSLVGHNCTFEGSIDSTNGTDGAWFAIQAVRTNANTIELTTGTLAATPAYGWELSVNGLKYVRVRATAHTSGTAAWKFQQAPYATEPIPAAQVSATQPISGAITSSPGGSATAGNGTRHSAILSGSNNLTSVKASGGGITCITVSNSHTAGFWLKLYNKASAPVLESDVPVMRVWCPAGQTTHLPQGCTNNIFATGIAYATSAGISDGVLTANTATINILYT